jgi:hypothetical protein
MKTPAKLLLYLLISFVLTYFFLGIHRIRPGDFVGDGGDTFQFSGFMYLAKQNIKDGKWPYTYTNDFRYKSGFDYSCGFDGFFSVTSGALLSFVTSPSNALNMSVFTCFLLNIFLSWISFEAISRKLTNGSYSKFLPFILALIYGASPYVFARAPSHLSLFFIAGFPITLLGLVSIRCDIRSKSLNLKSLLTFYIGLLLIAFGSIQYILLLSMSAIILVIALMVKYENKRFILDFWIMKEANLFVISLRNKTNLLKLIFSTCAFLTVFLFVYKGYFKCIFLGQFGLNSWNSGATILDILVPNPYLGDFWNILNLRPKQIEYVVTPGIAEIVFFVWVFKNSASSRIKRFTSLVAILYVLFVLNILKIFFVPENVRFVVIAMLVFCLFVTTQNPKINNKVSIFLISVLILERLFYYVPISKLYSYENISKLRSYESSALLNVPATVWSDYSGINSALANYHGKKMLEGHLNPGNNSQKTLYSLYGTDLLMFVCDESKFSADRTNYYTKKSVGHVDALISEYNIKFIILQKTFINNALCVKAKEWWSYYILNTQLNWKVIYDDSESTGYYLRNL